MCLQKWKSGGSTHSILQTREVSNIFVSMLILDMYKKYHRYDVMYMNSLFCLINAIPNYDFIHWGLKRSIN